MAYSFQSKDEQVLSRQLAVQELCITTLSAGLWSKPASDVLVDVKETVGEVVSAIYSDFSTGSVSNIAATFATTVITLPSVTLAAGDAVVLKYVIAE